MLKLYTLKQYRKRIRAGATLYLSNDCGILSEFEDLTGLRVEDSVNMPETDAITLNGTELPLRRKRLCIVTPVDPALTVLARDRRGIPAVTSHPYGKGTVLYVNFPAEAMLLDQPDAFAGNTFLLYRLLDKARQGRRVTTEKRWVSLTEHPEDGGCWCVAVNLSDRPQNPVLHLADGWRVDELRRGKFGLPAALRRGGFPLVRDLNGDGRLPGTAARQKTKKDEIRG